MIRERLAPGPACCNPVPVDRVRLVARCGYQRQDGEGRFRTAVQLGGWQGTVGGALTYTVDSSVFEIHSYRDSYRAGVQKSLALGCGVCSDVEMVVGGTSTTLCRRTRLLRTDAAVCMDCYTYYILHNDLREDIKST